MLEELLGLAGASGGLAGVAGEVAGTILTAFAGMLRLQPIIPSCKNSLFDLWSSVRIQRVDLDSELWESDPGVGFCRWGGRIPSSCESRPVTVIAN